MTLLKHQKQKFASYCGPACIAMLAQTDQKTACRAMFDEVLTRDCYSNWDEIRLALQRLGVKFGKRVRRVTKWQNVPDTAIVACSRYADNTWHWVVCSPTEHLVYDPEKPSPIPVSHRRKPFSYLTVRLRHRGGGARRARRGPRSR
jgi:hypothetical protein